MHMKLQFDDFGYLIPYEVTEADLDLLEKTFVFNEHRRWLYKKFLLLLEKIIGLEIEEDIMLFWINGSFVTRKEFPKNIDVVVFIHYQVFAKNLDSLRNLQSQFHGKIDFYFEPFYPENHKLHSVFLILKNDWEKLYLHTRRHPDTQQIHKKGFLEINLNTTF